MTSSNNISPIAVFCKELRDARAYQQVTLAEIEHGTHISSEYLLALELGRWEEIPRAYLRGYLALYASAVGMNRDKVLRSFDRLQSAPDAVSVAEFDEFPGALRQPQAVGVTRAKIRVSWFVALSSNRRVLFLLTAAVLVFYLLLLRFSRRPSESSTPVTPFAEIAAQYHERIFHPFYEWPLADSNASLSSAKNSGHILLIGAKKGQALIRRDSDPSQTLRFSEYDTVSIQFNSEISVTASPRGSLRAMQDTIQIPPDKLVPPNSDFFIFSRINPIAAPFPISAKS